VIFTMVADGRLTLTAVVMLASHLTPENHENILAAAANLTNQRIEELLAERFPKPIPPSRVIEPQPTLSEQNDEMASAARRIDEFAPAQNDVAIHRARITQVSAETVCWQVPVPRNVNDKLRYAKELLGHQVPAGADWKVHELALDALIEKLEKRKFGACRKRRTAPQRVSANPRRIPPAVKSEVWKRDAAQCTFTSEAGHRCPARSALEFDHIEPVARGGRSTVDNLRLRCRAHNQFEAERTFGAGFMKDKREAARQAVAERVRESVKKGRDDGQNDVIPWLRGLGIRVDEARRAAALCDDIPDAPLEQRVRRALSYFKQRPGVHVVAAV
jgi:5-methylcytosine-specific restriction endonuclease McrA